LEKVFVSFMIIELEEGEDDEVGWGEEFEF
jgi:hypothetical protein